MSAFQISRSIDVCRRGRFARYNFLALTPVRIASFKDRYSDAQKLGSWHVNYDDRRLWEYFAKLDYYDKDYFSVEELKFLFETYPIFNAGVFTVESDREYLLEMTTRGYILEEHAKVLRKAMDYYELRSEESGEWRRELSEVFEADLARRRQIFESENVTSNEDASDEGYSSDVAEEEVDTDSESEMAEHQ